MKKLKMGSNSWVSFVTVVAVVLGLQTYLLEFRADAQQEQTQQEVQAKQEEQQPQESKPTEAVDIKFVDGKAIITTSDGQVRTFNIGELENGAGLIFKSLSESKNGNATRSRAILVGPDGDHRVIFDQGFGEVARMQFFPELTMLNELPTQIEMHTRVSGSGTLSLSDYAIGVQCRPIDDAMMSQLDLHNGLVVEVIHQDSAALESGIKQFDVLVRAEQEPLIKIEDLTRLIQTAGDEQASIKMVVVRKGQQQELTVKPRKRVGGASIDLEADATYQFQIEGFPEGTRFHRVLPGLIANDNSDDMARFKSLRNGQPSSLGVEGIRITLNDLVKQVEMQRRIIEEIQNDIRDK